MEWINDYDIPSIAAWRALIGSISVISTLAPNALRDCAQPFPTSPYPATTQTLPAIITSVARLIPSTSDSRHPYKLSNLLWKKYIYCGKISRITGKYVYLGNRVIDIDSRNLKFSVLKHFVEVMHARCSFFTKSFAVFQVLWVFFMNQISQITAIVQD